MAIEIRVLSGALAGQIKRYEQAVIVVGRQAGLDLRFDPQQDLDVSGRHAELRATNDGYEIHDSGSTNGTYVNGKKVSGSAKLSDGDKIKFGAKGPETECHITAHGMEPDIRRTPARSTEQRIAIAVTQQTAGLKRAMIAAGLLVVVGGGGSLYYMRAQSAKRTEEFNKLIADNEAMRVSLQSSVGATGDTALVNEIQRKNTALKQRLAAAKTETDSAAIKSEMQENDRQIRRMVSMDLPSIFKANAAAVAFLIVEIDGKSYSGTGFSISKAGHIITNKHNVLSDGKSASRIAVKFTNTRDWLRATVVKVSDTDDIALLKMDGEGPYPFVTGVSATNAQATEGMFLGLIGYPLGYDLPQEGEGNNLMAKATLNSGIVSKLTSSVLQIDSYATHGSSGSPVFSTRGYVVGLIYGGAREAGGKIVYAVPPERIAAFIPAELRAIVKD